MRIKNDNAAGTEVSFKKIAKSAKNPCFIRMPSKKSFFDALSAPFVLLHEKMNQLAARRPRLMLLLLCAVLGVISYATYSNSFVGGMVLDNAIVLQIDRRLQPPMDPKASTPQAPVAMVERNIFQFPWSDSDVKEEKVAQNSSNNPASGQTLDKPKKETSWILRFVKEPYRNQIIRTFTENYWWPSFPTDLYRPLTTLSYFFNYTVLGSKSDTFSYHVVNLILHWINACLVLLICRALWPGRYALSFLAAALFALHPVAVESVTNIVGRADLLSTLSIFLAGYIYIRLARLVDTPRLPSENPWVRKLKWVAGIIAFVVISCMGVLTKESAVMVAGFVFLYDIFYRWQDLTGSLKTRLKIAFERYFLGGWVWVIPCIIVVLCGKYIILKDSPFYGQIFIDNPIVGADWFSGRMTAIKVLGLYLGLLVFPRALSCDYSFNQIPVFGDHTAHFWDDLQAWIALAVIVGLFIAAWRLRRRSRAFSFGICLFFLMILPTSNLLINIGSIMGERFLYLPLLGFAIVAAVIIRAAARWLDRMCGNLTGNGPWVVILPALILGAFGLRAYVRNFDWRNDVALWRSAVETCPRSFKVHKGYAGALRLESQPYQPLPGKTNELDSLELSFLNATRLREGKPLLSNQPDPVTKEFPSLDAAEAERVQRWRNVFPKEKPGEPEGAELYVLNFERKKAGRKPYEEDPKLDEHDMTVRRWWVATQVERGLDKALARVEEGIRILDSGNLPDSKQDNTLFFDAGMYYNTKAKLLEERGDVQEAMRYYQRAYEILWRGVKVDMHVAKVSKESMRSRDKKETEIIEVGNPKIRTQFVVAALRLGRLPEAYESALQARRILPMESEQASLLGIVLREMGRADEARSNLVQALLLNGQNGLAWQGLKEIYAKMPEAKGAIIESKDGNYQLSTDNLVAVADLRRALVDLEDFLWANKRYTEAREVRQTAINMYGLKADAFPLRDPSLQTGGVARSGRDINAE